jgi:hypothetical protein
MRLLHQCEDPQRSETGRTRDLFRLFRQATGRSSNPRLNPHLDPTETASTWKEQYKSQIPDNVRTRTPFCRVNRVFTADDVKTAVAAMHRCAPGPDGLDFLVIQVFIEELAPVLARFFTYVAREGLPDDLREAETILIDKPGKKGSSNPLDYRPITLLAILARIYQKILEIALVKKVESMSERRGGLLRTQAGFRSGRSCMEQAFLLQLLQAVAREGGNRQFLGAILVDIQKAFDSVEYSTLLEICQERAHLSPEWLEILRLVLAGNRTRIMGIPFAVERGTPQGGALSTILFLIFMNDLALTIDQEIAQDRSVPFPWRSSRTARNHEWSLPDWVDKIYLLLAQLADDTTYFPTSPTLAKRALQVILQWASRRHLVISPKTDLVLLSSPENRSVSRDLEAVIAGNLNLNWNIDRPFRLLGYTCHAAFTPARRHGAAVIPLDWDKVRGTTFAISAPFKLDKYRYCVNIPALRRGIDQCLYSSALYQTTLSDVDYKTLDSKVYSMLVSTLQLPPRTPSCYVRWELRLWPSALQAHKRAVVGAITMLHHHWQGRLLRDYLETCRRESREDDDLHPIFNCGPVARWSRILKLYDLRWFDLLDKWQLPWKKRRDTSQRLVERYLRPAFVTWLKDKITTGSPGIPAHHRQQILRDMCLPDPDPRSHNLDTFLLPIYLHVPSDLARAGFRFRAPYWRVQLRNAASQRHPCVWCDELDAEHGYHIIRCPCSPSKVRALRDRALSAIWTDMPPHHHLPNQDATSEPNIDRLFHLRWSGTSTWLRHRPDRGQQPSLEALTCALLYMREAINVYASHVAGTGMGDSNPVVPLPVYHACPPVSPEEVATATQAQLQELTQEPEEDSDDEAARAAAGDAFLDSLASLPVPPIVRRPARRQFLSRLQAQASAS